MTKKNNSQQVFKLSLDEPIMTSGVVSRLLDIPIWVLKQLDRENVVSPPRKKSASSRLYSQNQVKELKKVWYYMSVKHVNVSGVKVVLAMEKKFGIEE